VSCELALRNASRDREVRLRELRPWLVRLVGALAPEAASFAVRLVGDTAMRRLNRTYRGKDYATDVLSFPGEVTPEGHHLGDVVIAVPTARRQAATAGHPLRRELEILLLHGVLHCLGYDHEKDDGTMDRLEAKLRRQWLTPTPGVTHA
jgi:probable rRNA maturation factor